MEFPIAQDFGIFAMVIKDAQVTACAEQINDANFGMGYWVRIQLDYTHPSGGRNGSGIGTVWFKEDGTVVDCTVN